MPTPDQAARLERQNPAVLGIRIRNARRAAGLGQADVASDAGISISYISRIEAGKRRADLTLLSKIADRLTVSIDSLLDPVPATTAATMPQVSPRPAELDFAAVALEMGEARTALQQLDSLNLDPLDPLAREALHLRGRALETLGDGRSAVEVLEQIVLPGPDPLSDIAIAIVLSRCYRESGEVVRAIRVGESALEALASAKLDGGDEAVQLAVTVAAAYFEQGDREYAVRLCRRTLAAAEVSGTTKARAAAYWNSAVMDHERGNSASAVHLARRALALLGEGQDERNLGRLQAQLGLMELRLLPPDLEQAEVHLTRASALLRGSSASHVDLQRMEFALARLELLRGDAGAARQRALSVPASLNGDAPHLEAQALVTAGEAALELGEFPAAQGHFLEAVRLLAGMDAVRSVAQLWLDLGARLQDLGNTEAAADAFQRAAVAAGLTPAVTSPSLSRAAADSPD